jgi:di/tricarboxylate transporter
MSIDLAVILLLLIAAIAMFVIDKPRMDVVALIMIVALPLTGVITMNEALAGFSDSNIVLIAALFVIGEGLVRTGVARRIGDWLNATSRGSETRLLVLLMPAVAGLGAFMSSTAVVAIFIPVVMRIAQNTGTSSSRLMMPLSFAALISGMMTLVATAPNLVVNAELVRHGASGFAFFSFTPIGVPVLILGIVYILFARRWLVVRQDAGAGSRGRPHLRDWIEQYKLADREHRVRIAPDSSLVGKCVGELPLRTTGVDLLAIERLHRFGAEMIRPRAGTELQAGDVLFMDFLAPQAEQQAWREQYSVEELPLNDGREYFSDRSQELGMAELILPADSILIGETVLQARVRTEYGLSVIGLRRGQTVHGQGLLSERLRVGDTLLVIGFWSDIRRAQRDAKDFVVLNIPAEYDEVLPAANKAPHAVGILALVVALMVSGRIPNVQAGLIGCLLMGLFGCVDMNSAYRSISWKTLVLIVGMLPFAIALERTGGVDLAAKSLIVLVGNASPKLVLASLFAITAIIGLFISNTATAVLMAPVALAIAHDLNASPYPFAMIVALAASTAFMTPISSPVNTLVVGPGNYVFGDFVRIGVPFALLVLVVSVFLVSWLMPP